MTAPSPFFHVESPYVMRNLREQLERRKAELMLHLASNFATDWADYKRRVGVLEGIVEAIVIINELEKSERN